MNTKSSTATLITTFLGTTTGASVVQIAEAIGKSQSIVRENLVKLTTAETVLMDATSKPIIFSLPLAKKSRKAKADPQAKADKQADPDVGRGDLSVKSGANLHPQSKINRKAEIAKKNGSSVSYVRATKSWKLVTPRGTEILTCRAFAGFSYPEWEAYVVIGTKPAFLDEVDADGEEEAA
jgi:hypothetical protein